MARGQWDVRCSCGFDGGQDGWNGVVEIQDWQKQLAVWCCVQKALAGGGVILYWALDVRYINLGSG